MKNWTSMLIALVLTAALCFGAAAGMAEGVLTLPSAVKEIQAEAFAGAKGFAEIILPEGVEKIGERAFAESSIEQIRIPDGVTDIGTGAFYNCVDLVSADVSDGVTEIADYLFWRCLKLEQVDIPAGVTRIGEHAFSACIALPEIEIPDGVTEIGEYAFSECASLTEVTIPGSVQSIGRMAFYSCLDLQTVVIEDGVKEIAQSAFLYCTSLTRVEIPASVTSIHPQAFYDCDELTIYGETGSYAQTYAAEWGIPLISEAEAAFEYVVVYGGAKVTGYTGSDVNVVIPETLGGYPVTAMERTFDSNRTVETVVLPSTLKKIVKPLVCGCNKLKEINIPASARFVGDASVLWNCQALQDHDGFVIIDGCLYDYADEEHRVYGFRNEKESGTLTLPDGITEISSQVFSHLRISAVVFPGSLKIIGENTFEKCPFLKFVEIPGTVEKIKTGAFQKCASLDTVKLGSGVKAIGANAFASPVRDICIPASVKQLGKEIFGPYDNNKSNWGSKVSGICIHTQEGAPIVEYAKQYAGVHVVFDYDEAMKE